MFQEKACCDEPIMLDWVSQQWNNCFINPPTNGSSGKILIACVHRAQQTDEVKCILKKKKADLNNVPPGCTSRVQPLDVVFQKPFKDIIRRLFEQHIENLVNQNLESRIDENLVNYTEGKITASQRGVLIAKWVGTAWSEISKKEDMISLSSNKCGIALALDGSENADLKSIEEVYEFQLQSESSICEEEQEDILFYIILSVLRF